MTRISFSAISRKDGRIMLWLLCLLMFAATALAPGAGPYEISRYTIDGGGGMSIGGSYMVTGTIGQPDAGWSIGGKYELLGGFWPAGPIAEYFPLAYSTYNDWLVLNKQACWYAPYQCDGDVYGRIEVSEQY